MASQAWVHSASNASMWIYGGSIVRGINGISGRDHCQIKCWMHLHTFEFWTIRKMRSIIFTLSMMDVAKTFTYWQTLENGVRTSTKLLFKTRYVNLDLTIQKQTEIGQRQSAFRNLSNLCRMSKDRGRPDQNWSSWLFKYLRPRRQEQSRITPVYLWPIQTYGHIVWEKALVAFIQQGSHSARMGSHSRCKPVRA